MDYNLCNPYLLNQLDTIDTEDLTVTPYASNDRTTCVPLAQRLHTSAPMDGKFAASPPLRGVLRKRRVNLCTDGAQVKNYAPLEHN